VSHRAITLAQVLSPAQLKDVEAICQKHSGIERTAKLKAYYGKLADMLKAQGIDPNYLAYATDYLAS
jgi:hypothetical protein